MYKLQKVMLSTAGWNEIIIFWHIITHQKLLGADFLGAIKKDFFGVFLAHENR